MIRNTLITLLCLFLFACGSGSRQPVVVSSKTITDSIDKAYAQPDTLKNDDDPEPSPAQILKGCLSNYKQVTTVDTTMLTDSGALRIHLKHYCTYDDGIILPEKYLKLFGLKTFGTHNFVTDVVISKNMRPVYAGRITNDDFLPLLDGDLKKYGALLDMDRRLQPSRSGKGFIINYSLSIPLTDVGRPVTIAIEPNGTKQVFLDYGGKKEKTFPADSVQVAAKNNR
jgi:hypothetical protein